MNLNRTVFILSLLTIISSFATAQSWLWAVQPGAPNNGLGDPYHGDHFVATDEKGNAYVTGIVENSLVFGSDTVGYPHAAFYLAKYDSGGNALWARQCVDTGNAYAAVWFGSVALDNNDNVLVSGLMAKGSFSVGPYRVKAYSSSVVVVVKYDENGNVLWVKQSGIKDTNTHKVLTCESSIATDKWGDLYVTGFFRDTVYFGSDTLRNPIDSSSSVFLVKYDPGGNVLWAKQSVTQDNSGFDEAFSVATDDAGDAYITGMYYDTIVFDNYSLHAAHKYPNMFLVKYDSAGNVLWANQTKPLDTAIIYGTSVATQYNKDVYVTGYFRDSVVIGNDTLKNTGGPGLYLAKYNPNGNLMWVKSSNSSDTNWFLGSSLVTDTLRRGGGYMIAMASSGSIVARNYSFVFGKDTIRDDIGQPVQSADILMQFDSLGHIVCHSMFTEGVEDDGTSVAVSRSSKFDYVTGDISNATVIGDSLTEGNDVTFLARWHNCCGAINLRLDSISDTCNKPNGIAIAQARGTTGPYQYSWTPSGGNDSIADYLTAGSYTVLVTDAKACSQTASTSVTNISVPASIQACCDTTIAAGDTVMLNANASAKYAWTPATNLSCDTCASTTATPTVTTKYYVTVSNKQGCSAIDSVLITVKDKPCGTIFMPNAFSPNGDDVNDILYVYGGCISALDFKIYDRWGNLVFETTDPTRGWNGTYNGKPMNSGVYDYTLVAVQSDNKAIDLKGNITLVR